MILTVERNRSCGAIFCASIRKSKLWSAFFVKLFICAFAGNAHGQDLGLDSQIEAVVSLPLESFTLTSPYGLRTHPVTGQKSKAHYGIDLRANYEPVYAVLSGVVISVGYGPVIGLFVRIKTDDFLLTYGHLSFLLVSSGQWIGNGEAVAISGASGRVTGPHLHFGVNFKGSPVNPLRFLGGLNNNSKH